MCGDIIIYRKYQNMKGFLKIWLSLLLLSFIVFQYWNTTIIICKCHESGLDHKVLVYNRIPKTGSTAIITLLTLLGRDRNFALAEGKSFPRHLDFDEQYDFARRVQKAPKPLAIWSHVHFMDLAQLDAQAFRGLNPVYLNSVRDPIERLASRFHYHRRPEAEGGNPTAFFKSLRRMEPDSLPKNATLESWLKKNFEECVLSDDPECVFKPGSQRDSPIAYFCGQNPRCLEHDNRWALNKALENIDKFYPVVLVLERFEESLKAAEKILPNFFNGAYNNWLALEKAQEGKINEGPPRKNISIAVREKMRENLRLEYELYNIALNKIERS